MSQKFFRKSLVLIINDSEEDSFFIERALRQSARVAVVGSVSGTAETIDYLLGQGQYVDRQLWPFPEILLMDFKHPGRDGLAVMEWMRGRNFPGLKAVTLTGSSVSSEIKELKEFGTTAFYEKSPHRARLESVIGRMEELLLNTGASGEIPIDPPGKDLPPLPPG